MEKRGFTVEMAGSIAAGKAIATVRPPKYAVVDLRLEDGNGLEVVEVIRSKRPESRIVILTGNGANTTATSQYIVRMAQGTNSLTLPRPEASRSDSAGNAPAGVAL